MSQIFISHSSVDRAAAKELRSRLRDDGHEVFLDFDPLDGIPAGSNWEQELYRRMRGCRAVVVLCSRHSMASKWCFMEITHARALGKALFPAILDDCELDPVLRDHQAVDLGSDPEAGYQRLRDGLLAAGLDPTDVFVWDGKRPPYPGMLAFQEEDAALFFGRDREIGEGLDLLHRVRRLAETGWVMVLGASGTGKSSLVRAGLVPRLRRDKERWIVIGPVRPREDPERALAEALASAFRAHGGEIAEAEIHRRLCDARPESPTPEGLEQPSDEEAPESLEPEAASPPSIERLTALEASLSGPLRARLAHHLAALRRTLAPSPSAGSMSSAGRGSGESGDNPLLDLASRLRKLTGRDDPRVLLVVDQFEELLGREPVLRHDGLLTLLRQAAEEPGTPVMVLGTMRSDFLGQFQKHPALRGLRHEALPVGPMSTAEVTQVIERPAEVAEIELESGLVQMLVEDAETDDALPLLAFTLHQLYERYGADGKLEIDEYRDKLGGLKASVAKTADDLTRHLDPGAEAGLRRAFLRMVRVTEEGTYARQTLDVGELEEWPEVRNLLETFVDARLLVAGGDGASQTLEVAHEALFWSWGRLRTWLRVNTEMLNLARHVGHAAAEWTQAEPEEKTHHLWTGGRLERASELQAEGELPLDRRGEDFLEASREGVLRARRRGRRRRAAVLIFLAGVAAAAVFAALLVNESRREAQTALVESRRQAMLSTAAALAGRAQRQLERHDDVELATLEARQAFLLNRQADGPARDPLLDDTMRAVLAYPHPNQVLRGHESDVHRVAVGPEGRLIAAGAADGAIRIWDVGSRERTPRMLGPPHDGEVRLLAFTPNGELVSGARDGVRIWSLTPDPRVLRRLKIPIWSSCAELSGSGRWLFTCSGRTSVKGWDLQADSVEPAIETGPAGDRVRYLAVSFDGSRLVGLGPEGLQTWDPERGWSVPRPAASGARRIAWSPDEALVAVTTGTRVWLWRLNEESEPVGLRLGIPTDGTIFAIGFDADGRWLAVGGMDGDLRLLDVENVRRTRSSEDGEPIEVTPPVLRGHARTIRSVAFHGSRLVTGSGDHTVRLWDWQAREALELLEEGEVRGLGFFPLNDREEARGSTLVAAEQRSLVEWRLAAGLTEESRSEVPGRLRVRSTALDPKGKRLLYVTGGAAVLVPDLRRPRSEDRILFQSSREYDLQAAAWDPSGARVAWAGRGSLGITVENVDDPDARRVELEAQGLKEVRSLAFSRQGWLAAAGYPKSNTDRSRLGILLFRHGLTPGAGGEFLSTAGHRGGWQTAAFDPDGSVLAVGGGSGIVLLWRFAPGSQEPPEPEVLSAHLGVVWSVAFDRDGRQLATASDDGTAKVWQVDDLQRDPVTLETSDKLRSVAFSPDGTRLAVGGRRQLRIFSLVAEELADRLCERTGRNFSVEEWNRIVGPAIPYQPTCPHQLEPPAGG